MTDSEQDRVLEYGDDAATRAVPEVLSDDALAYGKKKKKPKSTDKCSASAPNSISLIIGGGFWYGSPSDEVSAIDKEKWCPTTADLRLMGGGSGHYSEESDIEGFINAIAKSRGKGYVAYLGHGGPGGIVFSGEPCFTSGAGALTHDEIKKWKNDLRTAGASLHPNAKVELITCGTAADEVYCIELATELNRCVRALPVEWEAKFPEVDNGVVSKRLAVSRLKGRGGSYQKGWKHLRKGLKSFAPAPPSPSP